MDLAAKALMSAAMGVLLGALSRTRRYYIAGLVPLFPTFALIAHWVVGSERPVRDLRETVLFGMAGMVPYVLAAAIPVRACPPVGGLLETRETSRELIAGRTTRGRVLAGRAGEIRATRS